MSKSSETKHLEMMSNPEYAREFALQEDEFQIARVLLRARLRAGMTQKEVAERMGTTQSVVARMESGKPLPSLSSINRYGPNSHIFRLDSGPLHPPTHCQRTASTTTPALAATVLNWDNTHPTPPSLQNPAT